MTEEKIRAAVLSALEEIQVMSGRTWTPLSDNSRPIGALAGFDSPNGVEFCCAIELKLDCEIPDDENLCVEDLPKSRRRARSVKEIVQIVSKIIKASQKEVSKV
jgi:acyl carrier protein